MPEQLLGKAHALFGCLLNAFFCQFGEVGFHGVGAQGQAAVVGDLDVQARPGIEFQNQRAFVLVQHHVDADIAQAAQLIATGGQLHKAVPVGQLHAVHRIGGVRVFADDAVQPRAAQGQAGCQVDTHTDGALVQVGLAARLAGRQAQHGHYRVAHQHNNANVRYAFIADAFEDLVRRDAVLDQCPVTVPAQGIQAGEDAGNLMFDFFVADDLARHGAKAVFEAVSNHQDAIAARALCGLDHEVRAATDDVIEFLDFFLGGDHPVQLRHINAGGNGALFGDDLVIHNRVQAAFVVLEYVVRIAPIDAHDALGFQGLPGLPEAKHQESAFKNALKRTSSVRR